MITSLLVSLFIAIVLETHRECPICVVKYELPVAIQLYKAPRNRYDTRMKKKLRLNTEVVRTLRVAELRGVIGGEANSGSQPGTGSVTCPPPKNGDGGGCLTA